MGCNFPSISSILVDPKWREKEFVLLSESVRGFQALNLF